MFLQFYPYFIGKIGILRGKCGIFKNDSIYIENIGSLTLKGTLCISQNWICLTISKLNLSSIIMLLSVTQLVSEIKLKLKRSTYTTFLNNYIVLYRIISYLTEHAPGRKRNLQISGSNWLQLDYLKSACNDCTFLVLDLVEIHKYYNNIWNPIFSKS